MDNGTLGLVTDSGPGLLDLFSVAGVLMLMLGVLFAAFWILKRYGHKAGLGMLTNPTLKMEARLPLGPKKQVVVLRYRDKHLVLGVTDQNITLLTETDITDDDQDTTDFSVALEKENKRSRS